MSSLGGGKADAVTSRPVWLFCLFVQEIFDCAVDFHLLIVMIDDGFFEDLDFFC